MSVVQRETPASDKSEGKPAAPAKLSPVPPFRSLATTALAVNAVPVAVFLLRNRLDPALATLGGFVLGLALCGMLYGFVNYGLSLFVPPTATQDRAQQAGQVGGFAALMVGKFLVIGVLLFVLVILLKLNVFWLVMGFLLTQITMVWATVARLAKTKVTD